CVKQRWAERRQQMRFHDLLRRAGGRLLPTSTAERQIHLVGKLLEGVDRLRHLSDAAVDGLKDGGKNRFRLSLAHLRTAPEHLGSPAAFFPPTGNPHSM